jgi:hypothetical protein
MSKKAKKATTPSPVVEETTQPKSDPEMKTETETTPVAKERVQSTVANPVKLVWQVAEEMKKADPNVRRKDVVAECIKRGVALHTARTQYQRWSKSQTAKYDSD